MKWTGKKVGLALGGGGVRGFSHIGVLHVLEQEGIALDLITGTSAGALIGGAYASGQSPREIKAKIGAYLRSPEFDASRLKSLGLALAPENKSIFRQARNFVLNRFLFARSFFAQAILPADDFQALINYFIPDIDVSETKIPFRAVTTDLVTGRQIAFASGSLRQAVLASCSVPGAVEPVRYGDWILADGGITSLVPVHAAREAGADVVIAVLVDAGLPAKVDVATGLKVFYRAGEITTSALLTAELADADVVIRPEVGDLHWMDFSRAGNLVANGEQAARAALAQIYGSLPLHRRLAHFAGRYLFSGDAGKRSRERALADPAGDAPPPDQG